MKILLDEGLPRSAAQALCAEGFDAVHIREIMEPGTSDNTILEKARQTNAVVVTLDADFHALLAISGANSPSVIRIRIEGLKADGLVQVLRPILCDYQTELEAGTVISIDDRFARMKRLPIRRESQ